jgi:uncharacterized protein YjbJ (UPF0337 family)
MGFLDKLLGRAKDTAGDVVDKARDVAADHAGDVKGGITKAADFVDEKTGGRASGAIDKVEDVAGDVIDTVAGTSGEPAEGASATDSPASS